jgi:hypothetical protein
MHWIVTFLLFLAQPATQEPQWLGPVAEVSALDCPEHAGNREFRSEVGRLPNSYKTYLRASANTRSGRCLQTTQIVVSTASGTRSVTLQTLNRSLKDASRGDLDAPTPERSFAIVDSSSDGKFILLERTGQDDWHDNTFRDVDVAIIDTTFAPVAMWTNAWDVMHWNNCNATVEAQGFDPAGRVILRVRPSVWQSKIRPDCVGTPQLWAADLASRGTVRLPDSTPLRHNARATKPAWQTCKEDPDLVAACFTLHGRLSLWNGTPTVRIWRVGTKRILGVPSDTLPQDVDRLFSNDPWADDIYGDFEACPLTPERPGEMQMVCISSASHLIRKRR